MSIEKAFESFMTDNDYTVFQTAVDDSTKASWGGSGYSVELFPDGSYRTLWDNHIGNRYDSPGIVLKVPPFDDEEWDEDISLSYYGTVEEVLHKTFAEVLENYEIYSD
jgi:uncharacterized protein YndB with AHSA1/START domain